MHSGVNLRPAPVFNVVKYRLKLHLVICSCVRYRTVISSGSYKIFCGYLSRIKGEKKWQLENPNQRRLNQAILV